MRNYATTAPIQEASVAQTTGSLTWEGAGPQFTVEALVEQPPPGKPGFVYLAGPYAGADYCEIDAHINEARRWAIRLAGAQIPFFSPHLNSSHFEVCAPDTPHFFWLTAGLEILQHARAILLLPDWRDSPGAKAEMVFAQEHDIAVYTTNMFDLLLEDWPKADE